MKSNIHPKFNTEAEVVCSCGNSFTTGSIKDSIRVEVCYKCHPLYTGEKRFIDTLGQVGKFEQKQKFAKEYKAKFGTQKKDGNQKDSNKPKSLRELLMDM